MNCTECKNRISKTYYFNYKAKNNSLPALCKTCQKHKDIAEGKRKERPFDPYKERFFEVNGIVMTKGGILEKTEETEEKPLDKVEQ